MVEGRGSSAPWTMYAPTNVEYQCDPKLGRPGLVDCMNAEFQIRGQFLLVVPSKPFFINSGT